MHRDGLATCLVALALAPAGVASAATPSTPRTQQADEILDEVTVQGRRSRPSNPQQSFNWLARLVGTFTVEGYIEATPGSGTSSVRPVHGEAVCVGFGIAPRRAVRPAGAMAGSEGT